MTKDERAERKEKKVRELLGVFIREYQMIRAWGGSPDKAMFAARGALNKVQTADWTNHPQDRSFFLDCKIQLKDKIKESILALENGAKTC